MPISNASMAEYQRQRRTFGNVVPGVAALAERKSSSALIWHRWSCDCAEIARRHCTWYRKSKTQPATGRRKRCPIRWSVSMMQSTSSRINMARIASTTASIWFYANRVLVHPARRVPVLLKAGRAVIPNSDCIIAARRSNRSDGMGIITQLMLQNPETLVTPICPSYGIPPAISRNSADTG